MERIRNLIHGDRNPYDGLNLMPDDIQGWSSTSQAFEDCILSLQPKLIVEVGTWKGCSAIHMATLCRNANIETEIVCIDTYLGSWEHWTSLREFLPPEKLINGRAHIYEQFLSNVVQTGFTETITPFPIDSVNGALCLKHWNIKADMIYIDAGHDYDSVFTDLSLYKELVRPGGYLLGDDWFHGPIKSAVENVLGEVQTLSHDKFLWVRPNESN